MCGKQADEWVGWGVGGVNPLNMHKPSLSLDKRYKDISKNDKSFDRVCLASPSLLTFFWQSFDKVLKKEQKKLTKGFYPRGIFWGRGRSFHAIGKPCPPLWLIGKIYHHFFDILLTEFWHFVWPPKKSLLSLYWGNLPGGGEESRFGFVREGCYI